MIFSVPADQTIDMWELVAAVQLMQARSQPMVMVNARTQIQRELFHYAGFRHDSLNLPDTVRLNFAAAFRQSESSPLPYPILLGQMSGLNLNGAGIRPPQFPGVQFHPNDSGGIVLCPFEINRAFNIPPAVWKAVVRHLRSTGVTVRLLGDPGQRMDVANFTEGCTCSDRPLLEKMIMLAEAKLIVGLPNAWTWMATAWGKKVAVYYPDGIPWERWFGFYNRPEMGRMIYSPHDIRIPVVLAALRKLIDVL